MANKPLLQAQNAQRSWALGAEFAHLGIVLCSPVPFSFGSLRSGPLLSASVSLKPRGVSIAKLDELHSSAHPIGGIALVVLSVFFRVDIEGNNEGKTKGHCNLSSPRGD
jgi:hypothetical protein